MKRDYRMWRSKLSRSRRHAICWVVAITLFACANPEAPSAGVSAPTLTTEPLRLALASSDFAIGSNRLAFGVMDPDAGAVRDVDVVVSSFYLPTGGEQQGPIQSVNAVFREWPVSPHGVFTAQLEFDRAGAWGIGATVTDANGDERKASARVQVAEFSATPAIGAPAPASLSKTLADVDGFEEITTDPHPDADFYGMTIDEALDAGKPLMVVFSTPAYCQTATCGPQLAVIKQIKADYGESVSFIHIEVYDNPHEIEGDLNNAILSPTLEEWGLPSEPWTFVVDADGIIRAKFEAFTTRVELEAALVGALP